jgi:hypothetical protein
MSSGAGKRVAVAAVVLTILLLAVCGLAFRRSMVESWHLRQLESGDAAERRAAAEKLGALRSTRAVPALIKALGGADDELVKTIIVAAREIGSEAAAVAFAAMNKVFVSRSFRLARSSCLQFAAEALAEMGPAKIVGEASRDPMQRMSYAQALAKKQRYEEALDQYLWCYEHGYENSRSFLAVRNSFLLSHIVRLGAAYPPALTWLRDRRDELEARVLAEAAGANWITKLSGGNQLVFDTRSVAAINRELDESYRSLELFERLKDAAALRALLLDQVIDSLLRECRYADILEAAPDIGVRLGQRIFFQGLLYNDESLRRQTIEQAGKYYQAFVGAGRLEQAAALAGSLIHFSPGVETYTTLVRAAALAGNDIEARRLLVRAGKVLTTADFEGVKEAREHPERTPAAPPAAKRRQPGAAAE